MPEQRPAHMLRDRLGALLLRLAGLLIFVGAFALAAMRAPDRTLESLVPLWAPPPSDFIELRVDGVPQLVHLRDEGPRGDARPIVLLHGTSASLHTWEGWVAGLKQSRRVITVDLPGFGLTGPNASGDYRDAQYLRFVAALLDHLRLGPVVLGGNSLGGEIAWEFAAQAPQRVAALVLVDAGGLAFEPQSLPIGFRLARLPLARDLMRYLLPRQLVERSVRNVYGDPARVTPALVDRYFEMALREGNRAALVQRLQQLEPGRHADRLASLKQPTLILWGGRDRLIPPEYARIFQRAIAGSRLVMFDELGHVPQEEDPARTLAALQDFLKTLD